MTSRHPRPSFRRNARTASSARAGPPSFRLLVPFPRTEGPRSWSGGRWSRFTGEHLGRAGTELIAMAAVGVGVAYGIGRLLHAAGVGS
jgi:cell wall-associated NlpC family hydrolase